MSSHAEQAKSIFMGAIEKYAPEQWPAFLDGACGGDLTLRERVEQLLQAHVDIGSIHTSAPAGVADQPPLEQPGTLIGPYKLVEKIGEGGMGVVYVATQKEPVRRKVALKIIKPGMDTQEVVTRFKGERQALAMMDHPNIAKVFDGGATDTGRPYFVMELVKGKPIHQFCDREQYTTRERLALFVPVCHGVQHAHQKGVIHRDIKPSNLLIEVHDVRPVPKIIDFGIAKAMGERLTDQSLLTGVSQMVGTPLYMSPEQAGESSLDVDTRSDVYSLGVVLYELLTGTTPFTRDTLQNAGHDELRRLICEVDPPRPSARVSTLQAADLSTISDSRKVEPRKLSQQLRGELDWIVMKALDKDRDRRYESASALAEDIERYLRDEPVLAGPPSAAYRLRKFARRNKRVLLTAAAGMLVLLLGVGAIGGSAGYLVRDRQVRLAEAVRTVESALDEATALEQQGKWSAALEAAKRAEVAADVQGGNEELRARVQRRIKDLTMVLRADEIRLAVSSVKDEEFDGGLGDRLYTQAFRDYGIDVDALTPEEVAQRMPNGAVRIALADALDDWARFRYATGTVSSTKDVTNTRDWKPLVAAARATDPNPWRDRLREAWLKNDRESAQELAASAPPESLHPSQVSLTQWLLDREDYIALLRDAQSQHPEDFWLNHDLALALMEAQPGSASEAVGFFRAALALRPNSPGVLLNLGVALSQLKRNDDAIACFERAIRIKPDYATAYKNLGRAFNQQGMSDKAIDAFRNVVTINPADSVAHLLLGKTLSTINRWDEAEAALREAIRLNPQLADAHNRVGNLLVRKKDLVGAEDAYRTAIRIDPNLAIAHYNLSTILSTKGEWDEAEAASREAIRLDPSARQPYTNLGIVLARKGDLDGAEEAHRTPIRIDPKDAAAYNALGGFLCDHRRDYDGAIAAFQRAIELGLTEPRVHFNLGNALVWKGELEEAIKAYRQAITLNPKDGQYHYALANTLSRAGKDADAIEAFRVAITLQPKFAEAHCNLGRSLRKTGQLREALEALQRGHELGTKDPNWKYPSAQWIQECQQLLKESESPKAPDVPPPTIELTPAPAGKEGETSDKEN